MDQRERKEEERERRGKKRRSMRGDFGLVQGVSDVAILYNYRQGKKQQERLSSEYTVLHCFFSFFTVESIEIILVRWTPNQKYRRKHGSVGGLRSGNEYDTSLVYSSFFFYSFLILLILLAKYYYYCYSLD